MFGTGGRSTAAPVEHTHGPCVRVAASELPEVLRRDHAHGAVAVAVAMAVELVDKPPLLSLCIVICLHLPETLSLAVLLAGRVGNA
jgi:hypothetical protein